MTGTLRYNKEKNFFEYKSYSKYFIYIEHSTMKIRTFSWDCNIEDSFSKIKDNGILFGVWHGEWKTDTFVLDIKKSRKYVEKSETTRRLTNKKRRAEKQADSYVGQGKTREKRKGATNNETKQIQSI